MSRLNFFTACVNIFFALLNSCCISLNKKNRLDCSNEKTRGIESKSIFSIPPSKKSFPTSAKFEKCFFSFRKTSTNVEALHLSIIFLWMWRLTASSCCWKKSTKTDENKCLVAVGCWLLVCYLSVGIEAHRSRPRTWRRRPVITCRPLAVE